jgi:hypothetical protein
MNVALWISAIVLSLPLAYSLRFTGATLSFGRSLSETTSGTGYQAAISPVVRKKSGRREEIFVMQPAKD